MRILWVLWMATCVVLTVIFLYHTWKVFLVLGGAVAVAYFVFAMIGDALRP